MEAPPITFRKARAAAFAPMVELLGVNFVTTSVSNRKLAPPWGAGRRLL